MKKLYFLMAATTMLFSSCVKDEVYVPPTPEAGDVVLNEIKSKGPVDDDFDFVELYNKGEVEVDISGYLINDAADPLGGFVIPAGTKIAPKGYYDVHQPELSIAVSSGGEDVSLGDPDGTLLDLVFCPASQADGLSFSRIPDGGDIWLNGTEATPGAANIGEIGAVTLTVEFPSAPAAGTDVVVDVEFITSETVTEVAAFYATGDAPVYSADNKLVGVINGTTAAIAMTDLNVLGEKVSFFIALTLGNGDLMYFDNVGADVAFDVISADPSVWHFYIPSAAPTLDVVTFSATPTMGYETIALEYASGTDITEARIYFAYGDAPEYIKANKVKGENVINDPIQVGDFTQTGVTISMANVDVEDAAGDVIAGTSDGGKISFYVRLALANGNEYYFGADGVAILDDGIDGTASDAFKADPTKWNTYTNKAAVSLTKFEFPANPGATDAINVVLEYVSGEGILEARIYYAKNDAGYIKGNKVKGEDDNSFTQTDVTINMKGLDVEDADGNVVGTTSDSGATIHFYVRIATATSEYYFNAAGGLMAVDDSPVDGAFDSSDAFKDDSSLWASYIVQ